MPRPFRLYQPETPIIHRLRVTPSEPEAGPSAMQSDRPRDARGRRSKRPHNDLAFEAVRHLIETTTLTYSQISKKTGVGRASICRWTRDQKWKRPVFAPRATDTVPSARNGQKLKLRKLAEKLLALTERYVRELEVTPNIEIETLIEALEVLKMARTEAMGRRNRRRRRWPLDGGTTGAVLISREQAIKTALKDMQRGGVRVDHAPQEAIEMLLDANEPVEEDNVGYRRRGR